MKTKHATIELNGKVYDALTGHLLRDDSNNPHRSSHKKHKVHTGRKTSHAHAVHSHIQKPKTLMRSIVKKPRKNASPLSATVLHEPRRILDVDHHKMHRAKQIKRSEHISKFGKSVTFIKTTATILPVKDEPEDSPPPAASFKAAPSTPVFDIKRPHHSGSRPDFNMAVQRATSHQQPHHPRTGRRHALTRKINVSTRIVNITAISLAVVMVIGIFAWQSVPNLSMKLASAKAGVSGTLPSYQPSGFSMDGPIFYRTGQLTLTYRSRSDNRVYQIDQLSSKMSDQTLTDNYLRKFNDGFHVLVYGGKTIYVYGENKATWIDEGVWYKVGGNFALSSEQLVRLAGSL